MTDGRLRIEQHLEAAGAAASTAQVEQLAAYLSLLERWNARMNLTALDEPHEAVDRLIVEPVLAAAALDADVELLVDVGSGGGSPAVPLKVMRPDARLVMVEIRSRKAVFLREVVRLVRLEDASVENARFEDVLGHPDHRGHVGAVSIRAVRAEAQHLRLFGEALRPGGQQLWFLGGGQTVPAVPPPLAVEREISLVPSLGSRLVVIRKARA